VGGVAAALLAEEDGWEFSSITLRLGGEGKM